MFPPNFNLRAQEDRQAVQPISHIGQMGELQCHVMLKDEDVFPEAYIMKEKETVSFWHQTLMHLAQLSLRRTRSQVSWAIS